MDRIPDVAKDVVRHVADAVGDASGVAHNKIGDAQARVADAIETGADAIADKVPGGTRVSEPLQRTAMWLRENDLADLSALLRRQLRTNPERVAVGALVVGFVFGRAPKRA